MKRLGFGKYSTSTWEKVPEDYLQWLVDNHQNVQVRSRAQTALVRRFTKRYYRGTIKA